MFNGDKLKELERRIDKLESAIGGSIFPGEDYREIRYMGVPRVSIRQAIMHLCSLLGVEFKRTPETLQLVTTKKK